MTWQQLNFKSKYNNIVKLFNSQIISICIYKFSQENPYDYMMEERYEPPVGLFNAHSSQEDIDLDTIKLER